MKIFGSVGKILVSYMIFISLIYFLNQNNFDRFSSFLIVLFSATVSLFYLGSYSKFGFNVTRYFIFALIFKIFIGFLFWCVTISAFPLNTNLKPLCSVVILIGL